MIVLDASAALELVLRTDAGLRLESRIFQPDMTLHAPHLIDVEVAHVLRRVAREEGADDYCTEALQNWLAMPVQKYPHDVLVGRIWELRANFTSYDAVYVALAEWLDAPLITHDRKLVSRTHKAAVELI